MNGERPSAFILRYDPAIPAQSATLAARQSHSLLIMFASEQSEVLLPSSIQPFSGS